MDEFEELEETPTGDPYEDYKNQEVRSLNSK